MMAQSSNLMRLFATACAGAGAFVAAAQWTRMHAAGDDDLVAVAPRKAATSTASPAAASAASAPSPTELGRARAERERLAPEAAGDAFPKLSWRPPPPPPPPPPPSPPPPKPLAPVAPPLPFTLVGMLDGGKGRPQAFLAHGEALLIVSAGDLLENNAYRVDSLSPTQIIITYLPLNTQHTLNVAGSTQ